MIVSAPYWNAHLPQMIEAIVVVNQEKMWGSGTHHGFLSRWGVSAAQVPLVRYDQREGTFT